MLRDSNYIEDLVLWPKFGNSSFSMRDVTLTSILLGFDQKIQFFEACSRFKFNNLGLVLGIVFKLYSSTVKGLKLKAGKFWGLIPTFVEVTVGKMGGGLFACPPSWIGLRIWKKGTIEVSLPFTWYRYFCIIKEEYVKLSWVKKDPSYSFNPFGWNVSSS